MNIFVLPIAVTSYSEVAVKLLWSYSEVAVKLMWSAYAL